MIRKVEWLRKKHPLAEKGVFREIEKISRQIDALEKKMHNLFEDTYHDYINKLAEDVGYDLNLSDHLESRIVKALSGEGITTLLQLKKLIHQKGQRGVYLIPRLGVKSASTLLQWLYNLNANGVKKV
jgi:Phage integrase protein